MARFERTCFGFFAHQEPLGLLDRGDRYGDGVGAHREPADRGEMTPGATRLVPDCLRRDLQVSPLGQRSLDIHEGI